MHAIVHGQRCLLTRSTARALRVDEVDDVLHRRAGQEDAADPMAFSFGDVDVRDDPADDDQHVVEALLLQQLHDARADVHVRAGQDRQADDVGVLLQRRADDLLGRLAEAGVDHLHAGVAQRPRNDLGAAVVPVEPGLAMTTRIF